MPIELLMPALSPTMMEGNIVKWHKREGDDVKTGDVIADIETDKAIMEMESIDDGKMAKIFVPEGSKKVPVNKLIALMVKKNEDVSLAENYQPVVSSEQSVLDAVLLKHDVSSVPTEKASISDDFSYSSRIKASPLAKRLSKDLGVNLSLISGSGPYGRIIKCDVLEAVQLQSAEDDCVVNAKLPAKTAPSWSEVSTMRAVIAQRLSESKRTVPHFYLTIDCMVDSLLALRKEANALDSSNKITVNDFIIKAVALSMKKFPAVNSSWIGDKILQYHDIDVSVAVGLDEGLITPIVRQADRKTVSDISAEMKELINKAKSLRLKPEEFQGGSVTISNLGMFGITNFSAIINPPQSCILAIGKSEKRPVIKHDKIEIATMMTVTLSADHRVVDGLLGAKFLDSFRSYIEQPLLMLL